MFDNKQDYGQRFKDVRCPLCHSKVDVFIDIREKPGCHSEYCRTCNAVRYGVSNNLLEAL